jgi:hypothetical protein
VTAFALNDAPAEGRGRLRPGWLYSVLILLLLMDAGAMVLHLIRVAYNDQIGHIEKIINGVALGLTLLPVLFTARFSREMVILSFVLLAQGMTVGLIRDHELSRPFVGQVYHLAIMTGGFALGYASLIEPMRMERFFTAMAYVILAASVVGYLAIESFRLGTGASLYVGYPSVQLFLPLAVFLLRRAWIPAGASLWIVLVAGKRGPLLALLIAGTFVLALRRFGSSTRAVVAMASLAGLFGWAGFAGMRYIVDQQVFDPESVAMRVATKWDRTVNFQDDLTIATSGRDVEIEDAAALISTPSTFIFGQGFGWWWDNAGEKQHYVHFSYMNYVVTYGLLLALVVMVFLMVWMVRLQRHAAAHRDDRLAWFLLFYLAASLLNAATANLLAVSLLFWVLLGVSARLVAHSPSRHREPLGALLLAPRG